MTPAELVQAYNGYKEDLWHKGLVTRMASNKRFPSKRAFMYGNEKQKVTKEQKEAEVNYLEQKFDVKRPE